MKRKIFIDDPAKRFSKDQEETELPIETVIRFESGNSKLNVSFCRTSGSIEIRESGDCNNIIVIPKASNHIIIS